MEIQETFPIPESPDLKLKEIAEKAKESEKQVGGGIMTPGSKQKRGPGRPPKAKPTDSKPVDKPADAGAEVRPQAQGISSKRIAEPVVKLASKAAGAYVGDTRAEMTSKELDDVAESLGLVLEKWMPLLSSNYGPEVLLVTTLGAYGVRVMALKRAVEESKKVDRENLDFSKPISEQIGIKSDLPTQAPGQYISPSLSV